MPLCHSENKKVFATVLFYTICIIIQLLAYVEVGMECY